MAFLDELRRRARHLAVPLMYVCVVGYFAYHAVQGERGVVAWLRLSQQIEQTRAMLAESQAEQRWLAHRVALLSPSGLDLDMLDERARAVLNLAHPDDRVVFVPGRTVSD